MGGSHSRPPNNDDDEDGDCQCFLFQSPVKVSSKNNNKKNGGHDNDVDLGSPMPDTPVMQRRHRQNVQEAMLDSATSSGKSTTTNKYSRDASLHLSAIGLEKELMSSSTTAMGSTPSTDDSSTMNTEQQQAMVYEGEDCEKCLHSKYELLEVIGVGSTSTVHRCVNKKTGEAFACKIVDCQIIEERFQGMMAQFQTEIEALRLLQHPGIIRLYDVYIKTNDKIFIVMEVMEGGELFDYVVQKGTLSEEEAAVIVRKVTSALVFMHSKNFVHRDLKPENLLLKQKPKGGSNEVDVKIIDFGLSKAMEEPLASTFLGTRGYLAPEMLQRRDYTRAVDTWALGIIVFVLLCGCLPFDDDSAMVPSDDLVRAKFVLRFPRWAKNLSASAKDLLNHLLDVNPKTRYTAEQALDHPWVRGVTAPKGNLLASPGRIKKSPMIVGGSAKRNGGRYSNGNNGKKAGRKYAADPRLTPPNPKGPIVRKGSI